jgi:hypothetical protein
MSDPTMADATPAPDAPVDAPAPEPVVEAGTPEPAPVETPAPEPVAEAAPAEAAPSEATPTIDAPAPEAPAAAEPPAVVVEQATPAIPDYRALLTQLGRPCTFHVTGTDVALARGSAYFDTEPVVAGNYSAAVVAILQRAIDNGD